MSGSAVISPICTQLTSDRSQENSTFLIKTKQFPNFFFKRSSERWTWKTYKSSIVYVVPEKFIVCLCDYFDDIIMNCHKNTVNVRPNWPLVLMLSSSFLSTIVSRNRGLIKGLDLLENGRNVTFCIFYKVPLPSPAQSSSIRTLILLEHRYYCCLFSMNHL